MPVMVHTPARRPPCQLADQDCNVVDGAVVAQAVAVGVAGVRGTDHVAFREARKARAGVRQLLPDPIDIVLIAISVVVGVAALAGIADPVEGGRCEATARG